MARGQSTLGNVSIEAPSFQVTLGSVNQSIKTNQHKGLLKVMTTEEKRNQFSSFDCSQQSIIYAQVNKPTPTFTHVIVIKHRESPKIQ